MVPGSLKVKDSDLRFTTPATFARFRDMTGVDWEGAYDPNPRNPTIDALSTSWDAPAIYLNPPFSKSRLFVRKLLDENGGQ